MLRVRLEVLQYEHYCIDHLTGDLVECSVRPAFGETDLQPVRRCGVRGDHLAGVPPPRLFTIAVPIRFFFALTI